MQKSGNKLQVDILEVEAIMPGGKRAIAKAIEAEKSNKQRRDGLMKKMKKKNMMIVTVMPQ